MLAGDVLQQTAGRQVIIAHRNDWFIRKVSDALRDHGLRVVARVENGADAVGTALAEQPDLLFVEDTLAMISGRDRPGRPGP